MNQRLDASLAQFARLYAVWPHKTAYENVPDGWMLFVQTRASRCSAAATIRSSSPCPVWEPT